MSALPPTILDTPCQLWDSTIDKDGYGRFNGLRVDGKRINIGAHRWVWARAYGPIPPGMCVLHKCDNPPCVRLDHLFLGTKTDNNVDRDAKGRTARHAHWMGPRLSGERHSKAKLTWAQVHVIRERLAAGDRVGVLAAEYGVSHAAIGFIKRGTNWRASDG